MSAFAEDLIGQRKQTGTYSKAARVLWPKDLEAGIVCMKRGVYSRFFFSALLRASKEVVVDVVVSG